MCVGGVEGLPLSLSGAKIWLWLSLGVCHDTSVLGSRFDTVDTRKRRLGVIVDIRRFSDNPTALVPAMSYLFTRHT